MVELKGSALELAQEMVYEHYTGKCWHNSVNVIKGGFVGIARDHERFCTKCNKLEREGARFNPFLATSLDAWAQHIWPVMSVEQWEKFCDELIYVARDTGFVMPHVRSTMIKTNSGYAYGMMVALLIPVKFIVLAALRAADVECSHENHLVDWNCKRDKPSSEGYYTCQLCEGTNGKRSLYELLMEEVGE
jgi:hypothetical protein